jgi:hypothetical protein
MSPQIPPETVPPRIFILLENPKKSNNLGPILRCAAAFATTQVVMVGYDKCNTEGSHGASKHVDMVAFPALNQATEYLRAPLSEGGCGCVTVIGLLCAGAGGAYSKMGCPVVEDVDNGTVALDKSRCARSSTSFWPNSYPVNTRPFQRGGNFCIVLSKNVKGLPTLLARTCDFFVHVPHVEIPPVDGRQGDLWLDVPSCFSITLHHLTQWAGYHERVFQGHKFQVASVQRGRLESFQPTGHRKDREELKQENEIAAEMALDSGTLGSVFDYEKGDYDY